MSSLSLFAMSYLRARGVATERSLLLRKVFFRQSFLFGISSSNETRRSRLVHLNSTDVDDRPVIRKDVCAQAQQVWSRRSKIDQQVAVIKRSRIGKRFLEVLYRIWENLSTEMHDLCGISRILEQNQVVSIETNISVFFALVEQILTYVNHAAVEMMRFFRENFSHPRISFEHEVVDEKRSFLATVQNIHVENALHKFDTVDASEQVLVTTEAPNYPLWRRMDGTRATNQLEYKSCFATLSWTDHHASERMF